MAIAKTYSIEIAGHVMDNVNAAVAADDDKLREALRVFFPNEMDPTKFAITREAHDDANTITIRFVPASAASGELPHAASGAAAPVAVGKAIFAFATTSASADVTVAQSQTTQTARAAEVAADGAAKPKPTEEAITAEELATRGVNQCEFHYEGQITPIVSTHDV